MSLFPTFVLKSPRLGRQCALLPQAGAFGFVGAEISHGIIGQTNA